MADKRVYELPSSLKRREPVEMLQAADKAGETAPAATRTIDGTDFRVRDEKSEVAERSERLRSAVRGAGGNKAVSARSGIPGSTLSDYLAGKEWKFGSALAIARACRVSLDWLADGQESDPENHILTLAAPVPERYIAIPRLDVRVSAGPGSSAEDEDLIGHLALDEAFLRNHLGRRRENLVSIEASGDSMDPTIRDGDMLVVDTAATEVQDSRIYILDVNGRMLVKRIQLRMDGSLLIKSDNPKYEAEIVIPSERNPIRIIGQVVYQAGPPRS